MDGIIGVIVGFVLGIIVLLILIRNIAKDNEER